MHLLKVCFIQDNFMLVQQTAQFLHQQRHPRLMLKLDITKAFDSVSWTFLIEVLQNLGFGQVWRDVISGLLLTSSTRVLFNGHPGSLISHKRGLRQADPLSSMLFVRVMDVLGQLFSKADEEGLLQPLSSRSCNTEFLFMLTMWFSSSILWRRTLIWFQTSFTFLERLLVYIIITRNLVSIPSGVMRTI
jgi:hypothetical protein